MQEIVTDRVLLAPWPTVGAGVPRVRLCLFVRLVACLGVLVWVYRCVVVCGGVVRLCGLCGGFGLCACVRVSLWASVRVCVCVRVGVWGGRVVVRRLAGLLFRAGDMETYHKGHLQDDGEL